MRFFLALLASAAAVAALDNSTIACLKESELDALVPACAQYCQQEAVRSDGCDPYENVKCHCAATGYLSTILTPCLSNSTCTQDELTALENLINPICTYLNSTTGDTCVKSSTTSSHSKTVHSTSSAEAASTLYSTHTYTAPYPTSWGAKPTYAPSGWAPTNSTSSPVKYWGNSASGLEVASGGLLAAVGAVAALLF